MYSDALARIHEAGFTQIAEAAAPRVTGERVLDLGCGGGTMASLLPDRAYTGIDLSPEMIRMARKRAPAATFIEGSIYETSFPQVDSVLAIGEVVNYAFVPRDFQALLKKINDALPVGGQFLFDLASPGRSGGGTLQVEEWTVKAWTETRDTVLTRHIEVRGADQFDEQHKLQLLCPEATREALVEAGFEVELLHGYGEPLGTGWHVFSCRKSRPA